MLAHKLADRGKAPWRMALTLVAVTAGASLVTWFGDGSRRCGCPAMQRAPQAKYVHIKVARQNVTATEARTQFLVSDGFLRSQLRAEYAALPNAFSVGIQSMFEQLEPDSRDDRARWIRVLTTDPDLPESHPLGQVPARHVNSFLRACNF